MESQYLKPIFKSKRTTLHIWVAITFGKMGPIHLLIKEDHMTLQIYIDQVFKQLGLPFYNELKDDKKLIIWINNNISYYTSKFTIKFCCQASLLYINWPLQLLNLNLIENL